MGSKRQTMTANHRNEARQAKQARKCEKGERFWRGRFFVLDIKEVEEVEVEKKFEATYLCDDTIQRVTAD